MSVLLLQLNGYPGMVKGNQEVIGEVYQINGEVKYQLDILEGSEYQYSSAIVSLGRACHYVHFYEYILKPNQRYS